MCKGPLPITPKFSRDGKYRYTLHVALEDTVIKKVEKSLCAFMLNPSKAGSEVNGKRILDPTVTRMSKRARRLEYSSLYVLNLFAIISPDPKILYESTNPVGAENDAYIEEILALKPDVVVAWGTHGKFLGRDLECLQMIYKHNITPLCLGLTQGGFPRHPLPIAYSENFRKYEGKRPAGCGLPSAK